MRFEWDGRRCRPFEEVCQNCHRPLGEHNKGNCPTGVTMPDDAKPIEPKGQANALEIAEDRQDRNLRLWRINETTDPGHTRPVKLGRSFTAIDAYYQIKRATETFGPLGQGWGWELHEEVVEVTGPQGPVSFAKCKVTLWYVDEETSECCTIGPVIGMNQLLSKNGVGDDEAFKKATTDGITKALSYLGFSADVFMGLYDDSKYVNRLKDEQTRKADQQLARLPKICSDAVASLPKLRTLEQLDTTWRALKSDLKKLPESQLDYMKARFAMRKRQLAPDDGPPDNGSGDPRDDMHTGDPHGNP